MAKTFDRLSLPGEVDYSAKKNKKIGHRRVTNEGGVTYKKKSTTDIQKAIQLGIFQAVGRPSTDRDVLLKDFGVVETLHFPGRGGKLTPSHSLADFTFQTHAPDAFTFFRKLYKVDTLTYLNSLCNNDLVELTNPGASGSIFFLSSDDEFVIKTVQNKEAKFLQALLPEYYMNLTQHPRTMLPKFYGLHCYKITGKNIRFVVMNNLLPRHVTLHEKYDLKGSTYKRSASEKELAKSQPTYKDMDFRQRHKNGLFLRPDTYEALIRTIERDCLVLDSFRIMDYSFLLGVHNLSEERRKKEAGRMNLLGSVSKLPSRLSDCSVRTNVSSRLLPKHRVPVKALKARRRAAYSTPMDIIASESPDVQTLRKKNNALSPPSAVPEDLDGQIDNVVNHFTADNSESRQLEHCLNASVTSTVTSAPSETTISNVITGISSKTAANVSVTDAINISTTAVGIVTETIAAATAATASASTIPVFAGKRALTVVDSRSRCLKMNDNSLVNASTCPSSSNTSSGGGGHPAESTNNALPVPIVTFTFDNDITLDKPPSEQSSSSDDSKTLSTAASFYSRLDFDSDGYDAPAVTLIEDINQDLQSCGGISAWNSVGDHLILFFGIIDILQSFSFMKRMEHGMKSVIHDGDSISVQRPDHYASRFCQFLKKTVFHKLSDTIPYLLKDDNVKDAHIQFILSETNSLSSTSILETNKTLSDRL